MLVVFKENDLIVVKHSTGKIFKEFCFIEGNCLSFSDGTIIRFSLDAVDVFQLGTSYISKDSDNVVCIGLDIKWFVYGEALVRSYKVPWL